MQSIKIRSHVGQDGILHLEIPVGMTERDLEVMVIFQPLEVSVQQEKTEKLDWSPNFFEQTAGCLQDDPLVRYPQGEYEQREPME
jgi:hypothetical protein